ncbi:MAG TPA: hypothetical protein VG778_10140, partial [Blastocatellia bacterium]|nr:hypothetical protein [Blastocatellia bacterium]
MARSNSEKFWNLIAVRIAGSNEEAAASLLFELGATGTVVLEESEENISVGGYFAESADTDGI